MLRYLILTFETALVIVADLVTKYIATIALATSSMPLIPHVLTLELAHNPALAFGIPLPRIAIIGISIVVLIFISYIFVYQTNRSSTAAITGFALIFGGAIGNLAERIASGAVTDFVRLAFIPNFNLADTALTLGALTLILFGSRIFGVTSRA